MKLRFFSPYLIFPAFKFTLIVSNILIAFVLLFLAISSSFAATPTFTGSSPFELDGQRPTDLEVVDINNDGILDVISTTEVGKINFLMGDGNGRLLKVNHLALLAFKREYFNFNGSLTRGDFNNDGLADLAVEKSRKSLCQYGCLVWQRR